MTEHSLLIANCNFRDDAETYNAFVSVDGDGK